MKRSISLMFVLVGMLGLLLLPGCQSGGAINADSSAFSSSPTAEIRGALLLIKLHDTGKNFMAVEKPNVTFEKETIVLTTAGFIQSAGGSRIYRYDCPRRFLKADITGKVFWTNIDGSKTAISAVNSNIARTN
jgi:hypothetical protein